MRRRMGPQWAAGGADVLEVLAAAATEGLSQKEIVTLTGADRFVVREVIESLEQLLARSADRYRCLYTYLGDWILKRADLGFDEAGAHRRLGLWCAATWQKGGYALGHAIWHLCSAVRLGDEPATMVLGSLAGDLDFWDVLSREEGVAVLASDAHRLAETVGPELSAGPTTARKLALALLRAAPLVGSVSKDPGQVARELHLDAALAGRDEVAGWAAAWLDARRLRHLRCSWVSHPFDPAGEFLVQVNGGISALTALPDGRVVFGATDGRIRIWDADRPTAHAVLGEAEEWVDALAALPDGRVVSLHAEHLWVWDPERPGEHVLLGEAGTVWRFAALRDGRVASQETDGLWIRDPDRTREPLTLGEAHAYSLAALWDGRLVSDDGEHLWVWDPERPGEHLRIGEAHAYSLTALRDGRVASHEADGLWIRDPGRPGERSLLGEVEDGRFCALPDGRVISADRFGCLCIWDPERPAKPVLLGEEGSLTLSLAVLHDGRVISGHLNGCLRLWNPEPNREFVPLAGPRSEVTSLAVLPGGRVISGHRDGRLWDWHPERPAGPDLLGRAPGRPDRYAALHLATLHDGRVVSLHDDGRLWRWDPERSAGPDLLGNAEPGEAVLTTLRDGRVVLVAVRRIRGSALWAYDRERSPGVVFVGETEIKYLSLAALPDGRVVSGDGAGDLWLWDLERPGDRFLLGRAVWLPALETLPDGRVVAGDWEGGLSVWDPERAQEWTPSNWRMAVKRFVESGTSPHGEAIRNRRVLSLAVLPDRCVASLHADRRVVISGKAGPLMAVARLAGTVLRADKGRLFAGFESGQVVQLQWIAAPGQGFGDA